MLTSDSDPNLHRLRYREIQANNAFYVFQSTSSGRIAFAIVRPGDCRPASIPSTISGASSVMRSSDLIVK